MNDDFNGYDSENYRVGKGRPPRRTRWRKGQSGNPKGRPKGAKNLTTIFQTILKHKVEIREKAGRRKISGLEALVWKMYQSAMGGNLTAAALFFEQARELGRIIETYETPFTKEMSAIQAAEAYAQLIKRREADHFSKTGKARKRRN